MSDRPTDNDIALIVDAQFAAYGVENVSEARSAAIAAVREALVAQAPPATPTRTHHHCGRQVRQIWYCPFHGEVARDEVDQAPAAMPEIAVGQVWRKGEWECQIYHDCLDPEWCGYALFDNDGCVCRDEMPKETLAIFLSGWSLDTVDTATSPSVDDPPDGAARQP